MQRRARMGKLLGWSAVVLVATTWFAPASAEAGGRRYRSAARVPARRAEIDARVAEPYPGRPQSNPYEYYRSIYPKFYGGFHEHEFSNLGVPTGDVGLRGNGLFLPAW